LNKKILFSVIGAIFLYAASAGVSFIVFNTFLKNTFDIPGPLGSLIDFTSADEEGVKDRECPLNGAFYTKNREEKWQSRRPLAIMVENHADARPTQGLSRSDVIYEAVAEGGITRFLAIYLCQDAGDISPVRSARTYYLDWLSEYDAAYAHVGGANTPGPANALGQIIDYGVKDMDQFGLGFPTFWRGTDRFAPHNVHTTTKKLWEAAEKRGYGVENEDGTKWDEIFKPWKFKDDPTLEERGNQTEVVIPFWSVAPDYTVTWKYDKTTNTYNRFHADVAQTDPITDTQLAAKVVIVQFQRESDANDGYPDGHLLYGTTGSGGALIFQDGNVIEGRWIKGERLDRTSFVDAQGEEVELTRGLIWIETVPIGNEVTY